MKILFITIGTSEIQINNNPGAGFSIHNNKLEKDGFSIVNIRQNRGYSSYLLKSPRNDGETIFKEYLRFKSIIELPLILPVINFLIEKGVSFEEVWLIYTDQKDADENFKVNDTLYFKDIVKLKLKEILPSAKFNEYGIEQRVRDIDYQYKLFGQEILAIAKRKDEIEKVYLLPQGGIDQINQALTLQLIQLFKDKVILYQNAEKANPEELEFPSLFLHDLTKQNVIKHIKDFDFDKATDLILDNEKLHHLAVYAGLRLNLLHSEVDDSKLEDKYRIKWVELSPLQQKKIKLQDLIFSFKILLRQRNFNEALTKLFSITDNLFKFRLNEYTNEDVSEYYDKSCEVPGAVNKRWENFIEEKLGIEYLKQVKKKKKRINNPNFLTESYLFRLLIEDEKIPSSATSNQVRNFTSLVNDLRDLRNAVVHNLGAVSETDVSNILKKYNDSTETFLDMIDKIAGTRGFGVFSDIQENILLSYGERID